MTCSLVSRRSFAKHLSYKRKQLAFSPVSASFSSKWQSKSLFIQLKWSTLTYTGKRDPFRCSLIAAGESHCDASLFWPVLPSVVSPRSFTTFWVQTPAFDSLYVNICQCAIRPVSKEVWVCLCACVVSYPFALNETTLTFLSLTHISNSSCLATLTFTSW